MEKTRVDRVCQRKAGGECPAGMQDIPGELPVFRMQCAGRPLRRHRQQLTNESGNPIYFKGEKHERKINFLQYACVDADGLFNRRKRIRSHL